VEKLKKKRKRKLKALNKAIRERLPEEQVEFLMNVIEDLNWQIKRTIKKERVRIINKKLQSSDSKCFWQEIRKLQGKAGHVEDLKLTINGKAITEQQEVAESFVDFFAGKVDSLSEGQKHYQWVRDEDNLILEEKDLDKALKNYKGKMSTGSDGILMKIVKDSATSVKRYLITLMNKAAREGMPDSWRMAAVRPLHKKGLKTDINNYRPVSNLQSISKLYEKMILNRIDEDLPGIEGEHQHGFRKGRSTVTALLELQSEIVNNIDMGRKVATYSIDMTAAFDLLRPNIFHTLDLPKGIMNTLMDFMSNRKMKVVYGRGVSTERNMHVGCVQGSVLGPKLFAIYCKDLLQKISPFGHLTSYADDSYVTINAESIHDLKTKIETSLETHEQYMQEIGMIVNKAKTELVVFDRKNHIELELSNGIKSKRSMKALGITFSDTMSWKTHIDNIVAKSASVVNNIKFLRRWIDMESALKVVTSQYFGLAYYASPVWMTPDIPCQSWKKLNSLHYRAIRAAVRDLKQEISRPMLDTISQRATPAQWARYTVASTAIHLVNNSTTRLAKDLKNKMYINDRMPQRCRFFNSARTKIGKQCFINRLDCVNSLNFNWLGDYSDDYIRINLKRQFFQI